MVKEKISATIEVYVLRDADADARALGLNRSELVERALRNEHIRIMLARYTAHTARALDIDGYAERVYQANRAAGR